MWCYCCFCLHYIILFQRFGPQSADNLKHLFFKFCFVQNWQSNDMSDFEQDIPWCFAIADGKHFIPEASTSLYWTWCFTPSLNWTLNDYQYVTRAAKGFKNIRLNLWVWLDFQQDKVPSDSQVCRSILQRCVSVLLIFRKDISAGITAGPLTLGCPGNYDVEVLLYVHRNHRFISQLGTRAPDVHLDLHTAPELCQIWAWNKRIYNVRRAKDLYDLDLV